MFLHKEFLPFNIEWFKGEESREVRVGFAIKMEGYQDWSTSLMTINPGEVNDNFSELFMQHTVQTRVW